LTPTYDENVKIPDFSELWGSVVFL
jgi:hypothetical protein